MIPFSDGTSGSIRHDNGVGVRRCRRDSGRYFDRQWHWGHARRRHVTHQWIQGSKIFEIFSISFSIKYLMKTISVILIIHHLHCTYSRSPCNPQENKSLISWWKSWILMNERRKKNVLKNKRSRNNRRKIAGSIWGYLGSDRGVPRCGERLQRASRVRLDRR